MIPTVTMHAHEPFRPVIYRVAQAICVSGPAGQHSAAFVQRPGTCMRDAMNLAEHGLCLDQLLDCSSNSGMDYMLIVNSSCT